jgi:hypothetical protein
MFNMALISFGRKAATGRLNTAEPHRGLVAVDVDVRRLVRVVAEKMKAIWAGAENRWHVVILSPLFCLAANSRTSCMISIEQNFGPHISNVRFWRLRPPRG